MLGADIQPPTWCWRISRWAVAATRRRWAGAGGLHRLSGAVRLGPGQHHRLHAADQHAEPDWLVFWREHRLRFQLDLAARHGHGGRLREPGERLLGDFRAVCGYTTGASLLHGDLWSGNYAYTHAGEPVIFDPAVYYGDREADLAMTELFGGFGRDFYAAYSEAWPLDAGYRYARRCTTSTTFSTTSTCSAAAICPRRRE